MSDADDLALALKHGVYKTYGGAIIALLEIIRGNVIACGWEASEVYDHTTDDYEWSMDATAPDGRKVGFSIRIPEAVDFDGEPLDGVNFALEVIEWGGRILGGLAPYNYTPQVWVRASDPDAVAERFAILEQAILNGEAEVADVLAQARPLEDTRHHRPGEEFIIGRWKNRPTGG